MFEMMCTDIRDDVEKIKAPTLVLRRNGQIVG
jgi:hypothetical protein